MKQGDKKKKKGIEVMHRALRCIDEWGVEKSRGADVH